MKQLPPLQLSSIPQETIDFFKNLPDFIDIGPKFNPKPDTTDWGKYEPIADMKNIEDSCFIVYYSSHDADAGKTRATVTLSYANEAVKELNKFMKEYPFPNTVRGRKLPIYLAQTQKNYDEIISQFGFSTRSSSVGVYLWEYSNFGSMARAIIISPLAWEDFNIKPNSLSLQDEGLKNVLWHEMNHFVFFTHFDYINNSHPNLWFTEGCAEYFAGSEQREREIDSNTASAFSFSSPRSDYSVYWVGYTAFDYYAATYTEQKLSELVSSCYLNNINASLAQTNNIPLEAWESGWKNYIRNKDYLSMLP